MATKKKAAAKKPAAKKQSAADGAFGDVGALLDRTKSALAALKLTALAPSDRQHSNGKLRGGEDKAIGAVLDAVDARPDVFASLAPRDHGSDDAAVETGPARDALARIAEIAPLLASAEEIVTKLSDEILHQGEIARDVSVPAYAIIKANGSDAKLAQIAKPAVTFYGRPARARKKKPEPQK